MKDIHGVLRQKQTSTPQLGKQIEMLQQAAEKLREVAPLLAENDDDDNAVLMDGEEIAGATDQPGGESALPLVRERWLKGARPSAPRWP